MSGRAFISTTLSLSLSLSLCSSLLQVVKLSGIRWEFGEREREEGGTFVGGVTEAERERVCVCVSKRVREREIILPE